MRKTKKFLNVESAIGESIETFFRREYFDKNKTVRGIARQISVSPNTLKYWAKNLGISLRSNEENYRAFGFFVASKEDLSSRYEKKSSNKIAEEYDVTGKTIRNWMERHGISRRVSIPPKDELSLKCETKTLGKIAEDYGVALKTIKNWRRNYGIATRKKHSPINQQERSLRIMRTPDKKTRSYVRNNFPIENNGREYKPSMEITLESLIDFYNPLFYKNKLEVFGDIFKNIINKTGKERLTYMLLHSHYTKLERNVL